MRFANDTRLVTDDANAFAFQKWQIVIELYGGRDVVLLVDELQAWFIVHLEDLGVGLRQESAKQQGERKDLSFHLGFIFTFAKVLKIVKLFVFLHPKSFQNENRPEKHWAISRRQSP